MELQKCAEYRTLRKVSRMYLVSYALLDYPTPIVLEFDRLIDAKEMIEILEMDIEAHHISLKVEDI